MKIDKLRDWVKHPCFKRATQMKIYPSYKYFDVDNLKKHAESKTKWFVLYYPQRLSKDVFKVIE